MSDRRDGSWDPVDEILRVAGERWRAAGRNAARTRVDASRFGGRAGRRDRIGRTLISLAGVAGAAVLLMVVIVLLPRDGGIGVDPTESAAPEPTAVANPVTPSPEPSAPADVPTPTPAPRPTPTPAAPTPAPDPIVRDGDEVAGSGYVVRFTDGRTRLCGWGFVLADFSLQCAQPSVDIVIDDPEVLPGWRAHRDEGHRSGWVHLEGRWLGGALHVERVSTAQPVDPYPRREPPCAPPPGGWPGMPTDSLLGEQAGLRLESAIEAEPSLYSGLGIAFLDPDGVSGSVLVVGAVGNVEAARRHLTEIYPYNLCVVEVDYSRAELEPVEERLITIGQPNIDAIEARVVVELPVLNEEAAQAIGNDADKVIVRPLLEKPSSP